MPNYDRSKLEGKSGFDLFMFETFDDPDNIKNKIFVTYLINALIFISIGAIVFESWVDNEIEIAQASAEQTYRDIKSNHPEIFAAINQTVYNKELYAPTFAETVELRLTSHPEYLTENQALYDIYLATANTASPELTSVTPSEVHENFVRAITFFSSDNPDFANDENYLALKESYAAWDSVISDQTYIKFTVLKIIDYIALVLFMIEYFGTCYVNMPKPGRYTLSVNGIIDAAAIAPSLIEPIVKIVLSGGAGGLAGLRIVKTLRLLRLMRLLRMLKLATTVMDNSDKTPEEIKAQATTMSLVMALMFLGMSVVMFSALMVFFERGAQPDSFGHITQAMWWGIITLTTVGYGDVSPITPAGQILAGVGGLMSVAVFAMLLGAVGGIIDEFMGTDDETPGVTISPAQEIATLADLLEAGHISQEEFDSKKTKLLGDI